MTMTIVTDVSPVEAKFLNTITDSVATTLAPKVSQIDKGYYPLTEMSHLGKAGVFLPHLSAHGGRFDTAILATAQIAKVCGTTGFLAWCHQVCGLYLDKSDNATLKQTVLSSHAVGNTFGGTALSNPMKSWANIETLLLTATKTSDGYTISGTLPWISHIAPNQYCGAVARVIDGTQASRDDIFFLLQFDDDRQKNWTLSQCPSFLAMEGSSTWRIELDNYPITDADIIAYPCADFIKNIRGAFVLMQLGIGIGIIAGAIEDIKQGAAVSNAFLEDQAGLLQLELDAAVSRTLSLAQTPFETDKNFFLDVLNIREQVALLALKATQSALLHQGARGYLMTASPQRRLREAQFLAIVTPAIKHLRHLSHQIMSDSIC